MLNDSKQQNSPPMPEAPDSSEFRYRRLFETARDGILILDGDNLKITDVNPYLAEFLGISREDLIGKELTEIGICLDTEKKDTLFRELGEKGFVKYEGIRLESLSGKRTEIEFICSAYQDGKRRAVQCNIRDITERRSDAEEIYFQSHLLNSVEQAIIAINLNLEITFWNKFAEKLYGWAAGEVLNRSILEVTTPHHTVEEAKTIMAQLQTGKSWAGEFEVKHKDGHTFSAYITNSPIYASQGKLAGFVGVSMDITDRIEARNLEALTGEIGNLAVRNTNLPNLLSNCTEILVKRLNVAFARIWLLNQEENTLELEASAGLYTNLDDECSRIPVGQIKIGQIAEERIPYLTNDLLNDPDPNVKAWASSQEIQAFAGYPLIVENHLVGVVGVFSRHFLSDKTIEAIASVSNAIANGIKRKQFEESLRQAEANYRNLVELTPAIVYLTSPHPPFQLLYLSPNIKKYGYQPEELFEESEIRTNIVHPEDREYVSRVFEEALKQNTNTDIEYRIIARDGSVYWVHDTGRMVYDEQGSKIGWQGVTLDITETKKLEEKLRQSQKLESVGRLAGGIAHDFNNMLTAINGYSELTLHRLEKDDPLRHNIEEIKKAGERSAELTRQLLAFSRQQVLKLQLVNLNDVLEDTSNLLKRLLGEHIHFNSVINPKLGFVMADFGQLSQIIINLAVNARDAMPHGGKLTIETANVFLDQNYVRQYMEVTSGNYIMLAVSDSGKGMTPETQKNIFEPFFTTKEVGQGTGLGLSTVYGIVKQSGGHIEIYSEEDIGSTFKIYLPRFDDQIEPEEFLSDTSELSNSTATILLVEDEEMVRNLTRQILEESGYTVIAAGNGVEALEIYNSGNFHFDLLLTDVIMPKMGGRELADKLKEKLPDLPVLLASGYTDDAVVRHGVISAGTNFIQKPFTPDSLVNKIQELLNIAR